MKLATYTPGNEPEEVKKYLDAFLSELDQVYPEGIVVMDLWNHERWDKMAGWLVSKLGYENGTEFLEAYNYVVFKENGEASGRQETKQATVQPDHAPAVEKKTPVPKGPTKYCVSCGAQIEKGASVCPVCGEPQGKTKFCKHCGARIDADCVVCPKCGKQVEELKSEKAATGAAAQQPIIINNTNTNTNVNKNNVYTGYGRPLNKWVAFLLCFFLGCFGAHKFYEGKTGMGILYLFTFGLCGIGWILDTIILLFKPNPYYVR